MKDKHQKVIEMYLNREPIWKIMEEVGYVTRRAVYWVLNKHGINLNRKRVLTKD